MAKGALVCITILVLLRAESILSRGEFASSVRKSLRLLQGAYDNIESCQNTAYEKANSLHDNESLTVEDQFYAVVLVNMYSNPGCKLFNSGVVFYTKLNKELRSPTRSRESKIWQKIGNLMNKALEILGLQRTDSVVYRGCEKQLNFDNSEFMFNQITSTSKNPFIAEIYCGTGTFVVIEDTIGVDIGIYSVVQDEDEILLPSTNRYLVEVNTRNKEEITRNMADILPECQPQVFVRLRHIFNRRNDVFSRVMRFLSGICRS